MMIEVNTITDPIMSRVRPSHLEPLCSMREAQVLISILSHNSLMNLGWTLNDLMVTRPDHVEACVTLVSIIFGRDSSPRSPNVSLCVCLSHLLQMYWTSEGLPKDFCLWSTKFTSLQVAAPRSSRLVNQPVNVSEKWEKTGALLKLSNLCNSLEEHLISLVEKALSIYLCNTCRSAESTSTHQWLELHRG